MVDFGVVTVGMRSFINAVRKAAPNGEPVMVSLHENGDWAVYGNGCYAQPCHKHEYICPACPECGWLTAPTASNHG